MCVCCACRFCERSLARNCFFCLLVLTRVLFCFQPKVVSRFRKASFGSVNQPAAVAFYLYLVLFCRFLAWSWVQRIGRNSINLLLACTTCILFRL